VGILYLVFVGPRLLPDTRKSEQEAEEGDQQPGMVRLEVMLSTRFPGLGKTLHKFDFYRHYERMSVPSEEAVPRCKATG
jgi:hypothetical protein